MKRVQDLVANGVAEFIGHLEDIRRGFTTFIGLYLTTAYMKEFVNFLLSLFLNV